MTQVANRALAEDLANSLKALEGMTIEELLEHKEDLTAIMDNCFDYCIEEESYVLVSECEDAYHLASELYSNIHNYLLIQKYGNNYKEELPF